eukprot:gene7051-146_t
MPSTRSRNKVSLALCRPVDADEYMPVDTDEYVPIVYPTFDIIYQDEEIVAIDKPAGIFAHRPEGGFPIPIEENGMHCLAKQLGGAYLYPGHRIDRATSGVLVYLLSREAASGYGRMSRERKIDKTYLALVRGHAEPQGTIDLEIDGHESLTTYTTLARLDLNAQPTVEGAALLGPSSTVPSLSTRYQPAAACPTSSPSQPWHLPTRVTACRLAVYWTLENAGGMFLKCVEMSFSTPQMLSTRLRRTARLNPAVRTKEWSFV